MSIHDGRHDAGGARRSRRRTQAVVGVAGLAAVLGGGAFVVTEAVTARTDRIASGPAIPPTVVSRPPATSGTPSSGGWSRAARSAAAAAQSPARAANIDAVRGSAARARDNVKRAPAPQTLNALTAPVTVTQTGSLKKGAILRVVSARQDLTGLKELAWAADQGAPVGDARCTQRFRFVAGAPPAEKPSLLLCWRTSATKSVYTVAVAATGRPPAATSVAAIDARWTTLF